MNTFTHLVDYTLFHPFSPWFTSNFQHIHPVSQITPLIQKTNNKSSKHSINSHTCVYLPLIRYSFSAIHKAFFTNQYDKLLKQRNPFMSHHRLIEDACPFHLSALCLFICQLLFQQLPGIHASSKDNHLLTKSLSSFYWLGLSAIQIYWFTPLFSHIYSLSHSFIHWHIYIYSHTVSFSPPIVSFIDLRLLLH